jgi:DNA mismatch repair protein MutS
MSSEATTPLMRQYTAIKKQHPHALLFFRLGDFYELFFDDAITAARELQITLTSRNKEKDQAIPMCGVPFHSADGYVAKLLRKGFKVAICEQMEDPKQTKTLVRREVTRILTPGTAIDSSVGAEENNFLAAVACQGSIVGLALLDLSTGEFRATEFSGEDAERRVNDELQQWRPREVLFPSSLPLFDSADSARGFTSTPVDDWAFAADYAVPLVENHFGVLSLEGYGLSGRSAAACAAGGILHYVKSTQRGTLDHVDRVGFYDRQQCLVLDAVTVRNLELIEPLFTATADGQDATLFRALDHTLTPMGKRLLRSWILRPSIERDVIIARLDAVDAAVGNLIAREELRRTLDGILDMERLLSRVTLESANPRDVVALASSFRKLPSVKGALTSFLTARLSQLAEALDTLDDVRDRIEGTLVDEPPLTLADGGVVRGGVNAELDDLRDLSRNGKQYIAAMEERERQRSGIGSLKIKFNSVFGYYIEISKANLHLVPGDYDRKQTLVNAERFTTPELKEYEAKVLDAQEKIVSLERQMFAELRQAIAAQAKRIRQTSLAIAEIDVLFSFAHSAALRNYCRSVIDESADLEIVNGRHPVVEVQEIMRNAERFVPNDLFLNGSSQSLIVLTGPNMGGKSTYLRQTALVAIMAQMGSFVPAAKARLGIIDRIFTRIGASDNLARGRSTFMVEMTETAAILNTATPRSLVLLDEMGRGTATYDGLALAWAAIEYLQSRGKPKTLFATHYHELTALADQLDGVKNFHVSVKENPSGIVFLRKVEPGHADRSYGIEVAKLAGLPNEVIVRARQVLAQHESVEETASRTLAVSAAAASASAAAQLTIFTPLSQQVVDRLRQIDVDQLTPIEALNLLNELKKQVQ